MKKRNPFLLIACLMLLLLSCSLPFLAAEEDTPQEPPQLPASAPQEPPQPAHATPEEINTGNHTYSVTPTSVTCELSTEKRVEIRSITFTDGRVEITNANKEGSAFYEKIGENRYMRTNDSGRPIVVTFNTSGYMMSVFDVGADPNQTSACAFYMFILIE